MTQAAMNYAQDLRNTEISKELLQQVKGILEAVPQVRVDFEDPAVEVSKKHLVIERIFPKEIRNFLKILCDNNDFSLFDEVCVAWAELGKTPEAAQQRNSAGERNSVAMKSVEWINVGARWRYAEGLVADAAFVGFRRHGFGG